MKRSRILFASLLMLFAFAALPAVSEGYDWCSQGLLGQARGFGVSGSLYGLGYVPVPPYFALHPPVYYGERYYRSYGESPFPRPDFSSRPKIIDLQLITNPFVESLPPVVEQKLPAPASQAAPAEDQVTSKPQMIINPYYRPSEQIVRN